MKRFTSLIVAVFLITMSFTSCILRDESSSPISTGEATDEETNTEMIKNIVTEETDTSAPGEISETAPTVNAPTVTDAEPSVTYPISFYTGNDSDCRYTLVTDVKCEFPGKDESGAFGTIANLGIMPSSEKVLSGDKYTALWLTAAESAGVKMNASNVNFKLSLKLKNGEIKFYEIKSPADAAKVGNDAYLSVLLFDDIHQVEGVAYSALSGDSYGADILVTTVRLVSAEKSNEVDNVTLSAEIVTDESSVAAGVSTIRIENSK